MTRDPEFDSSFRSSDDPFVEITAAICDFGKWCWKSRVGFWWVTVPAVATTAAIWTSIIIS